jgi:hypothetical protein
VHQNSRLAKLTPRAVAELRPVRYARKVSDGGGLYLLVTPKGSRCWRFAYRVLSKQKTLALGQYPDVSLEKARARHEFARHLLDNGIDPSRLKQVLGKHTFSVSTLSGSVNRKPVPVFNARVGLTLQVSVVRIIWTAVHVRHHAAATIHMMDSYCSTFLCVCTNCPNSTFRCRNSRKGLGAPGDYANSLPNHCR